MVQKERLEETYRDYYPLLFAIAYRMLGSASDAEDIVQECYLRYAQASPIEIHSPKSYLATIVTHLCLDYLKSARMQREQYAGVWLPEPILTADLEEPAWQTLEQHESISMAFLLLLERPPYRFSHACFRTYRCGTILPTLQPCHYLCFWCGRLLAFSRARRARLEMQSAIDFKYTAFLQLLQFADSASPIGAAAHSFGLETLVSEGLLSVEQLEIFLRDYLEEAGALECQFCQRGHQLAFQLSHTEQELFITQWLALNERLSAFKTVRESRLASASLGRRFLQLVQGLDIHPLLPDIVQAAKSAGIATHYSIAFGLIGGLLAVDATMTGLAYLQQSLSGLVFACQRLMPLGQSQASKILWQLQPTLLVIIKLSEVASTNDDVSSFTPLVDIGSMRHSALTTRLFIS